MIEADWRKLNFDKYEDRQALSILIAQRNGWAFGYADSVLRVNYEGEEIWTAQMKDGLPFVNAWAHFNKYYREEVRVYLPDYTEDLTSVAELPMDEAHGISIERYHGDFSAIYWRCSESENTWSVIAEASHKEEIIARCVAWLAYSEIEQLAGT